MKHFYSNGKLLITGEYVVLDGAKALALPTTFGQSLTIESIPESKLIWKSLDEKGLVWFENIFGLDLKTLLQASNPSQQHGNQDISKRLVQILHAVHKLNPDILNSDKGFKITTQLDFPRHWGLGTSSTLINNVAQWTNTDAFTLLKTTFGGSGYDIACAQTNHPILYALHKGKPHIKEVAFNPTFQSQLYFIYLDKKQNSRDGIAHYKEQKGSLTSEISEINDITSKIIACRTLKTFGTLITAHETIIAKVTKQNPVKSLLFPDFNGSIKSLGAWGGDFILAASEENPIPYFKERGFHTVLPYSDMIL